MREPRTRRLLLRHWLVLTCTVAALGHYAVLASLGDPFNFGTLLSLVVAGLGLLFVARHRMGRPTLPPRLRKPVLAVSGAAALWYAAMTTWMFVEARSQAHEPVDALLILGAGLQNGKPTPALDRRIDAAARYLAEHSSAVAIACGGVGPGQPASEAEVIRAELERRGIEGRRLLLEERSTSTQENVEFALPLIRSHVPTAEPRVLIVTSNFHLARAKMLARHQGLIAYGLPASTPWYILPNTTARESVAIIKSVALDLR